SVLLLRRLRDDGGADRHGASAQRVPAALHVLNRVPGAHPEVRGEPMSEPRRKRRVPRVGAFFDMDKTLISENSGSLYMKYRYERGEVDGWDLAKGLYAYLRYKAGILDIRAFTQQAMLEFRGQSERRLMREARDFVEKLVIPTVYPAAIETVRWHQAQSHIVAIVSGATKFVVRPLAEYLGIRHYLYTRLEVEHGRFTGRVIDPICFEEGKIYWLQQFID